MFGYRPPGTYPLVTSRSGMVHVRSGENLLEGLVRLRCGREVRYDRSSQSSDTMDEVTCSGCRSKVAALLGSA